MTMTAPVFPYLPANPARPAEHVIGVIGCGWIAGQHLDNYRAAGFTVTALSDLVTEKAQQRRDEYFPEAAVVADYRELLADPRITIVDVATHVDVRPAIIEDCLRAGKHVLSQKPFVLDLDEGESLIRLAAENGVLLAVNQNGRWAPHFAYLLAAQRTGALGAITSADFSVYWDHDGDFADHPVFSRMADLILYDFGIHWFDILANLHRELPPARAVSAMTGRRPGQLMSVPTQAQVIVDFGDSQGTLLFRASTKVTQEGRYRVQGTDATVLHEGEALGGNRISFLAHDGTVTEARVEGSWWENGMRGTMAELMIAIETGTEPSHAARWSLPGLALCFSAIESARTGRTVDPGSVRRLPD